MFMNVLESIVRNSEAETEGAVTEAPVVQEETPENGKISKLDIEKTDDGESYRGKTVSLFGDQVQRASRLRKNDLNEIMEARVVKRRLEGIVQAYEISDDENDPSKFGVYLVIYYGYSNLKILIPAEEFFVEIPEHPTRYNNSNEPMTQREWCIEEAKTYVDAPIDYQIIDVKRDNIFASRLQAMRQKELQYYFNANDVRNLKKKDKPDARVISVRKPYLIVDVTGVQTEIYMKEMGFQFVFDARTEYQAGMCFKVLITDLVVDTNQKKVTKLAVSRKELPEVKAMLLSRMALFKVGNIYKGTVVYKGAPSVTPEGKKKPGFYMVSFYNETMRRLHSGRDSEAWLCDCQCRIPKSFSPKVGEKVFVRISRFDKERTQLFGYFT